MTDLERTLELDSIDIVEPEGLSDLIAKIFIAKQGSLRFDIKSISAPLFIYKESLSRNQWGLIDRDSRIEYYVANHSNRATIHYSIEREILRLSGDTVSDTNRGDILVAFCKLELIIDAILLYGEGVYAGEVTYKDFYEKMIKDGGAPFHTFENKKKYLRMKKLIQKDTARYLTIAQEVRNIISHQYFLDFNISSLADIRDYKDLTVGKRVENVFNKAWLYLVRDYNPLQLDVLRHISDSTEM